MRQKGFTLVEVAIVLVILGLIIGLGIPMLRMLVQQNKLTEDRAVVKEAKQALIGYAYAHGGFPDVYKSNGLKLLPYFKLGIRATDANANPLIYDVNPLLTESKTGGNLQTFCQNVAIEMAKNGYPQIEYSDGKRTPVAFVVVSKSINYRLDDLNANAAKADNNRAVFDAPSHPYGKNYDDIVAVETFGDLYQWCQSSVGSQSESSGGSSGGGSNLPPKALLASVVSKILSQFEGTVPTRNQLKSILPDNVRIVKDNGKKIVLSYNGSEAIIRYNRNDDVKRVVIGNKASSRWWIPLLRSW